MHYVEKTHQGTRQKFMEKYTHQMKILREHQGRVDQVKKQVEWLKANLPRGHVLIKGDFIQNIVHRRGIEDSTAYYNKRQSQLLTFVVWHHTEKSTEEHPDIQISYFDYVSGYLKHTSLFFQKCFTHLLQHLQDWLPYRLTKVRKS